MLSFWEKNSFTNYDHIIIGSGILGLSVACEIKENFPERSVLIIEKGIFPEGASTKNAGFACFGSFTEILSDFEYTGVDKTVELISKKSKIEGEYGTKLLTKKIAELSEQINKGSIEIHEDVYVFCYYESGKAGVYNSSGHLMYTRAITPDERQTSIFSINKKAVNE